MGCCVGAEHNDWCSEYDIVYVDGDGKEYCIFHAPADCKFVVKYTEGRGARPAVRSSICFNDLVFARIQAVIDAGEDEERDRYAPSSQSIYPAVGIIELNSDGIASFHKEYSHVNWNPRCDFVGTVFPADISFSEFNVEIPIPPINFSNCLFKKEVSFYNSCFTGLFFFTDTVFENNACFSCKCQKGAYFIGAIFERRADFRDIDVKGLSNFTSSQFCCEAWFHRSQFHGKTIFNESSFKGELDFEKSHFHKEVSFEDVSFDKYVFFASTHFHGEAGFENASFKKTVDFQVTEFHGFANFEKISFLNNSGPSYRFCKFHGGVSFDDSVIGNGPNISECEFSENVSFNPSSVNDSVEIESCHFFKDLDYRCADEHETTFKKNRVLGIAIFSDSVFLKLNISNSTFGSQVFFQNTNFGDLLEVKYCTFEKAVNFNNANFTEAKTTIKDSLFNSWVYFRGVAFGGPTHFDGTICEKTILMERVNVKKLSFINMNIESFRFVECKWDEPNGYASIYDEDMLNKKKSYLTLEEIYRRLKKISRDSADEEKASNWHYKEKEMQRRRVNQNTPIPDLTSIIIGILFLISGGILSISGEGSLLTWLSFIAGVCFGLGCFWSRTAKSKKWFSKIYLNIYYVISRYGESPAKAGLILLVLILIPFGFQYVDSLRIDIGWVKSSLWFMPILKVDLSSCNKISGLAYFFKGLSIVAITIQAALFALRNRLRR